MLFMVIERFKNRDPAPIYERLRESGRSMPEGLRYVDSWIEVNFDRCFQLMEMRRRWAGHAVGPPTEGLDGVRGGSGQSLQAGSRAVQRSVATEVLVPGQ